MDRKTAAAMIQAKSGGPAFVLALLFGGLGPFYASVLVGIVMSIVELVAVLVATFTLGADAVLFPIVHLIAVLWALAAASAHNKRLVARIPAR